jgi:hypothetical protein
MSGTHRTLIALLAVFALTLAACKAPPDVRRTNFEIRGKEGVAKYDPKTGRLQKLDFDQNKNGRMDSFSYMDATRVIRIERVGTSSRDDEVQDTFAYPDDKGFLARVEFDTDRDGNIDKREFYVLKPGSADLRVLKTVEYDFKAGQPGRRLHYGTDGSFEKSEVLR